MLSQIENIEFSTFFLRHWEKAVGRDSRRGAFMMMLCHFMENQMQLDVERHIPLDGVLTAIELIEDESVALNGKIILTIETSYHGIGLALHQ
ncbi:hypothetical protein QWZ04_21045 [Vibrio tapetis subsp. quintayensis]|uniref:hypothetical protein n=1 Tax=Vibrio tapetis TaxID=52443 RepID=UPI0025B4DA36|nr:hypothetical protein [Vibrio tapetis]MDN3682795.1 hypothetical protein [Vibrio tapetis subsp. quintayensis]